MVVISGDSGGNGTLSNSATPNGTPFNPNLRSNRPASFLSPIREANQLQKDPAAGIKGMPPNFGDYPLPHVLTFQGIVSSISRVYRPSDEALKQSTDNARFMRNDPSIMECVEQRARSCCLLDWHLEPDNPKDVRQVELCEDIKVVLESIPRFMQYRENLLHAVWFGRYGIAHRWRWKKLRGKMRLVPNWKPIHGDKLVFRYDDGSGDYDAEQIGIRVGPAYTAGMWLNTDWKGNPVNQVEPTDYGLAYFLLPWQRPMLAVHKHYIEDGEYEEPMNAGRIHGVGVRSRIYWIWFQKQETLAYLMEYLERSAAGIEIWYYPWGNAEAQEKTRAAAEERIGNHRNIVLVPKPMGEEGMSYGVERIEPGMAGADVMKDIVVEYFSHLIKRYILGQTLTSEAQGTGLGSNLADVHLDTFRGIVRYDARNAEETITTDLVDPIKALNRPDMADVPVRFKIDTEASDSDAKLEAYYKAWQMNLPIVEEDVYALIGASKPDQDDRVLPGPGGPQGGDPMAGGAGGAAPGGAKTFGPMPNTPEVNKVYAALQADRDARQMQSALGIAPSEDSERQRLSASLDSGGDVAGDGWPSDQAQLQSALPHPSGFDPAILGRGFEEELGSIPDAKLALQVAQAKLKFNPKHYDREQFSRAGVPVSIDPRAFGAGFALEMQQLNDPGLAAKVATAKLLEDPEHYERHFRNSKRSA